MPRFDGTGPGGLGPMTGRGEGYCAIALPSPGTAKAPYGYAGLAGGPVGMSYPYGSPPAYGPVSPVATIPYRSFFGRPRQGMRFVRGRGRGGGRGRRRW